MSAARLTPRRTAGHLIDEYLLMIHPVVRGTGHRLFPDGQPAELTLVDSAATSTGVLIASYNAS